MRRHATLTLTMLIAAACGGPRVQAGTPPPPDRAASSRDAITSADQLFQAMRARYDGQWFRNITFTQTSTYFRPDGSTSRVETWYEAAALPGRLRIDLGDLDRANGVLYRGDSLYQIQSGKITDRRVATNPLLVLAFDVYAQPASRTFDQLRRQQFDLTLLRNDTLAGRRMYVVGAGPRDSTTNQFWIEADRLVVARVIQSDQRGRTQDIRFDDYVRHGGGWVAERVRFLMDGRLFFLEEYSNVRVDVSLDENVFVPERWRTATHWYHP